MAQRNTLEPPILIIGAGVAGLVLAQGLRLRSIPFHLFERHSRSHSSQGHRFRISKDGQTALDGILSPQLQSLLRRTAHVRNRVESRYVDARKLDFAKPQPVDSESMPVDRAWIRSLTSLNIEDSIEYGKEFESYQVIDERVQVSFIDGSLVSGKLLVGADGIKSRARKQLQPDRKLLDLERWIMWGRTPLTEELKQNISQDLLTWCMYLDQESNVQTIVEPMQWSPSTQQESGIRLPDYSDYIYWVTCTAPFQYSKSLPSTVEEKRLFMDEVSKTWQPELKLLFSSAAHDLSACVPVLSSKPDIEVCVANGAGRVTLVGDAAHPMSPMGGSGADTAIRNAAGLAATIADNGLTTNNISDFEARMEALAKDKIEHSFKGGQKFWRGKEWTHYTESVL
ncbi:putative FAD/NAD(P)-binding domain-containing protein [Seiridium unicorne]|uniref:FAD/NAD(P)-binding domain-containing protein n=1 Tax=Seiridium unicorne TaxID=138068 RepID=A0ABR2UTU2_9PEZI